MRALESRHLFSLDIDLHPMIELGTTPSADGASSLFQGEHSRANGSRGSFSLCRVGRPARPFRRIAGAGRPPVAPDRRRCADPDDLSWPGPHSAPGPRTRRNPGGTLSQDGSLLRNGVAGLCVAQFDRLRERRRASIRQLGSLRSLRDIVTRSIRQLRSRSRCGERRTQLR